MATTPIPISEPGIADYQANDGFYSQELFNSGVPLPATEDFPVAQSTTIAARSVVGLDGSGNLVMAKTSSTAVVPIGVLVTSVATASGQTDRVPVYRAGNFNLDALIFHADYDTDAKKAAAFRGSPSPTNVIVRKRL